MRDPERDPGRLEHILMAIDKIEEYTQGISYAQLVADSMRLHATVYNVQIVGEAAYKLTHEFKASHTTVNWKQIEKMRHILVHDYYKISFRIVWNVVEEDIPYLKSEVRRFLDEVGQE